MYVWPVQKSLWNYILSSANKLVQVLKLTLDYHFLDTFIQIWQFAQWKKLIFTDLGFVHVILKSKYNDHTCLLNCIIFCSSTCWVAQKMFWALSLMDCVLPASTWPGKCFKMKSMRE